MGPTSQKLLLGAGVYSLATFSYGYYKTTEELTRDTRAAYANAPIATRVQQVSKAALDAMPVSLIGGGVSPIVLPVLAYQAVRDRI